MTTGDKITKADTLRAMTMFQEAMRQARVASRMDPDLANRRVIEISFEAADAIEQMTALVKDFIESGGGE